MKFLDLKYDAFGLDINDLSVKVAKLEKKQGKFSLVSYGETAIRPGIVEGGIIKNEKTLANAIETACENAKIKSKYAVFSLPEEGSFLQVIQLPKMEKEELKSAVVFEAENYIPLPMDQVYLDFQIIEPIKDVLDHLDVLIVATPKKIVDPYVSCIKSGGLIPLAAEVESQAMVRALIKNETSETPLALIDAEKNNVEFIVFSGRAIRFTYSIPISLSIQSLNELVAEIKKYIEFYQEHASHEHLPSPEKRIRKIILLGGGADLRGFPELISKKLGVLAEFGDPFLNLPLAKRKGSRFPALSFITTLGLAAGGINFQND